MDGHPPHRCGRIMKRDLSQRWETGVGAMLVHERRARPSHAHVWME
jgi:hypothetical protein